MNGSSGIDWRNLLRMKTSIDIYQGIIIPLEANSDDVVKEHFESLAALKKLPKIDLQIADTTKTEMVVSVCKRMPKEIKTFYNVTKGHIRHEVILRFRINIDFEKKYFEDIEKEHVSKNFPSYFHIHDGIESYEKFKNEIFEILLTVESMPIATIQRMAKENRDTLNFKFIVE